MTRKMGRPPVDPPSTTEIKAAYAKMARRHRRGEETMLSLVREMTWMIENAERERRTFIWIAHHGDGVSVRELAEASHLGHATVGRIVQFGGKEEQEMEKQQPGTIAAAKLIRRLKKEREEK